MKIQYPQVIYNLANTKLCSVFSGQIEMHVLQIKISIGMKSTLDLTRSHSLCRGYSTEELSLKTNRLL